MIETCPKCNTKRIEDKNVRSLENEERNPCHKCYEWTEKWFETDNNEKT